MGQAFSADAALAAVCILAVAVAGMAAVSVCARGAAFACEQAALEAKAVSAADYLVKEGAAQKTGSAFGAVARAGRVDEGALSALDEDWLAGRVGARSVCVEGVRAGGAAACAGGVCVKRAVIFQGSGEAGYLVVCVQ